MRNRFGRNIGCYFSLFKFNLWVEEFWLRAGVSFDAFKWTVEFNITFLWFDLYIAIGRIK